MSGYVRPVDDAAWLKSELRSLRRDLDEGNRRRGIGVPEVESIATDIATTVADAAIAANKGIPYGLAAGRTISGSVPANSQSSVSVTLPAGRFTVDPVIVAVMEQALPGLTVWISPAGATSFNLFFGNATSTARSGLRAAWTATQMTAGSAAG